MDIDELTNHLKLMFKAMNDEELLENMAQIYWKLFSQLQKQGFTKQQALQIVTSYAANQGQKSK